MHFDFEKLEALSLSKANYLILLMYTILSIVFTYPVAFSINKIPGVGDAFWFLWDFWSFKKAVINLSNPYYTTDIFYPTGVSLAFSEVSPFNAIISIPLQYLFGLIATYNLIWILTFILSGFGAFLLVKYLTDNTKAAFLSGLIFMFCPYHFAHALGHMNLTSTEWIPFFVLFLIKTFNEEKRSNAVYAALFLALSALSSYYYIIYLSVLMFLYFSYQLLCERDKIHNKDALKRLSVMLICSALFILPFFYPMIRELFYSGSSYMYAGGFSEYSSDVLSFFIPSDLHPLFKNFVRPISANFGGGITEYSVFVGYTVIFLSLVAILKVRTTEIKFWAVSAVIFLVLSLGPILHVNGVTSFNLMGHIFSIPLPYKILMHIPIFSLARAPSRWDVLLALSLSLLSGFGFKYTCSIFKCRFLGKIDIIYVLLIIFSCLIIFEFLAIPYPMSNANVPAFFKEIAHDNEEYAILEIPMMWNADSMYYQTYHGKKLVGGYVSRVPDEAVEFLRQTPFINQLFLMTLFPSDILNQNITDVSVPILNFYDIRYIIIYKEMLTKEQFKFVNSLTNEVINHEPVMYEYNYSTWSDEMRSKNGSLVIYKVPNVLMKPFMVLEKGWNDLENWTGTPTRWMQANATFGVFSPEDRTANLSLQTLSFYHNRTLEIYTSDMQMTRVSVPTSFINVEVPVRLARGMNTLRFHVPEGCERPCDKPELNNPDSRCLSVAMQNLTLTYSQG